MGEKKYIVTEKELTNIIERKIAEIKKNSDVDNINESVNSAMLLLFTLPLTVLLNDYPEFQDKIPEFTSKLLNVYQQWQNNELNMQKLQSDLWEYGGVKLKKC